MALKNKQQILKKQISDESSQLQSHPMFYKQLLILGIKFCGLYYI